MCIVTQQKPSISITRGGLIALASCLVMLFAGCQPTLASDPLLDSTISFEQSALEEIPATTSYRVGIITEVTGTGAQIGDLSIRAARLAIEEINGAGGVNGVPLELVVRDARSRADVALAEYNLAVEHDNLVALLGPFKSAYGVLIVPAHQGQSLPMFIGATNETLTQQNVDNLFRMRPSDSLSAPAMLTFALEALQAQRIGLVHDTDAFGSGGAQRIVAELEKQGLAPAVVVGYETGSTEFDSMVQQLLANQVDTILIYGTNQTDLGRLLRGVQYWDLDVPIVTSPSGSSPVTYNVAAEAQNGIYVVLDAYLPATPSGQHFEQAFQERFGLQPDTYIAWYYDAIYLIADILRNTPDARRQRLSQLIRESDFSGVQGDYCFDNSGEGMHSVLLARMDHDQPQPLGVYSEAGYRSIEDIDSIAQAMSCQQQVTP